MKFLDVFDFDGTLWRNPMDTPENRKAYEEVTGVPWAISKDMAKQLSQKLGKFIGPRQGWYGRQETLQPPLVPDPVSSDFFIEEVVAELKKSAADPNRETVIMTGRHVGLAQACYRIIHDGKIAEIEKVGNGTFRWVDPNVRIFFLGNDGPAIKLASEPKPQETFPWKRWILKQFVVLMTNLEEINIWEDRPEHVTAFKELQTEFEPLIIKVFPVVS